ncbi:Uncharacterised domain DM10,Domain of unknown function DUF1126 [Cinara cedri]|uniref:DM10 domain-containing protein n=1 Tax=Cinara cedri TaxID=506608 RepID=A0A5E4NJY0_9HEMI|nr:Uncharacterised domain DM10,Domain of unknown function DUF1126 [Cinara cedri]
MNRCNDGLPFVPGYRFADIKTNYRKSSFFGYRNGYAVNAEKSIGIGSNTPLDVESVYNSEIPKDNSYDLVTLTYGIPKDPPSPHFKPQFVLFDGIVLSFRGFTIETIEPPSKITYRVRHVKICYYMVDNTISVSETPILNAGYVQGMISKRSRVPNPNRRGQMYYYTDLNVGVELLINTKTYKLCSCNSFTRDYMTKEGISVHPNETMPEDPYLVERHRRLVQTTLPTKTSKDCDEVEHLKLKRFIEYDGKVLRFYAAWYHNESEAGFEPPYWRKFLVAYYLVNDQIEINELHHEKNEILFPSFLKKMKLPMNLKNIPSIITYENLNENVNKECQRFYKATDLIIGNTICVMGRKFILYDCDDFTRDYFKNNLQIVQPDRTNIMDPAKNELKRKMYPPHNGFGDPDDTLRNCVSFRLQPPKSNFLNFIKNLNNILRYKMKMVPVNKEDHDRPFCMEFNLANDKMTILEKASRGFLKGKFMSAFRLRKPGFPVEENIFYGPKDFAIGSKIHVRGSVFSIVDLDEWTYQFMIKNPDIFTQDAIEGVKDHFINKRLLEYARKMPEQEFKMLPPVVISGKTKNGDCDV